MSALTTVVPISPAVLTLSGSSLDILVQDRPYTRAELFLLGKTVDQTLSSGNVPRLNPISVKDIHTDNRRVDCVTADQCQPLILRGLIAERQRDRNIVVLDGPTIWEQRCGLYNRLGQPFLLVHRMEQSGRGKILTLVNEDARTVYSWSEGLRWGEPRQ